MRIIKFRAWDKGKKKMFFLGDMWMCSEYDSLAFSKSFGEDEYKLHAGVSGISSSNIKDFMVMQYIGLKDKADKEIYEGDILRHKYSKDFHWDWVVEWSKNGGYFLKGIQEDIKDSKAFTMDNEVRSHEIIGNIWEHKNLLNGHNNNNS